MSVDGTVFDLESALEMKDIIAQLRLKLESTENELETILLENTDLNKQINKLITENKTLKSLCQSPCMFTSPVTTSKKKRRAQSMHHNIRPTPLFLTSPRLNVETNDYVNVSSLEQEILTQQQLLKVAQLEIEALKDRIAVLMRDSCNVYKPAIHHELKQDTVSTTSAQKCVTADGPHLIDPRRKIFIFGTQRCVGLAAAVSHSRTNTKYEKYRMVAITTCTII